MEYFKGSKDIKKFMKEVPKIGMLFRKSEKSDRGLRPIIVSPPTYPLPDNFMELWRAAEISGRRSMTFSYPLIYGTGGVYVPE